MTAAEHAGVGPHQICQARNLTYFVIIGLVGASGPQILRVKREKMPQPS